MTSRLTVLVIDDESAIRWSLSSYLEDSGYSVIVAADGEEGVRMFDAHAVDVVVVDLRMPRMDGLGVIDAIRARNPTLRVIALSGDGRERQEALRRGASLFMVKPIGSLAELVSAIQG